MNTKFKIGEKVIYKGKVYNVSRIIINQYTICYQIDNGRCIGYEEHIGILERELRRYESILDSKEKKYLENVIRPFKDKIEYLVKRKAPNGEYISFDLSNHDNFGLPNFKKNTMYIGMEIDKAYTLKELGLFEEDR